MRNFNIFFTPVGVAAVVSRVLEVLFNSWRKEKTVNSEYEFLHPMLPADILANFDNSGQII